MDFEFVHNDERLTVRAEVGENSIRVVDGDSKITYDFFSADGSLFTISAKGKATRVVAVVGTNQNWWRRCRAKW